MIQVFLAAAALALLVIIALQDYLVPSLRNATISSGLTGRYHVLLDVIYVVLAVALVMAFTAHVGREVLAAVSAIALVLTAATNTAWRWFDKLTDGQHSKLHSIFTLIVFVSALLLEIVSGGYWWLLNVALPAAAYFYFTTEKTDIEGIVVAASPAAEKLYVAGLCIWLMLQ